MRGKKSASAFSYDHPAAATKSAKSANQHTPVAPGQSLEIQVPVSSDLQPAPEIQATISSTKISKSAHPSSPWTTPRHPGNHHQQQISLSFQPQAAAPNQHQLPAFHHQAAAPNQHQLPAPTTRQQHPNQDKLPASTTR